MERPTDNNARIVFNAGKANVKVYLDNISLKEDVGSLVDDVKSDIPFVYKLEGNYPNPFNPATTIEFSLPGKSHVEIEIFDLLGRKVRILVKGDYTAGYHHVTWDGFDGNGFPAASGVYLYRMTAEGFTETRKLSLIR